MRKIPDILATKPNGRPMNRQVGIKYINRRLRRQVKNVLKNPSDT